jgi:hypothetical protein
MKTSMQNQTSQPIYPSLFRLAASLDRPDFSQILKPKPFRDTFRTRNVPSSAKSSVKKSEAI